MADPEADKKAKIVAAFMQQFADPLFQVLPQKIVEFRDTKAAADARTVAQMVADTASTLTPYKAQRNAFKTQELNTGTDGNLIANSIPFSDDQDGNDLFNALVACAYSRGQDSFDCTAANPPGWYVIYEKKAAFDQPCIDGILTTVSDKFRVKTPAECAQYADLLADQVRQAGQAGGGRRTRRRGRKGRKGSRRH